MQPLVESNWHDVQRSTLHSRQHGLYSLQLSDLGIGDGWMRVQQEPHRHITVIAGRVACQPFWVSPRNDALLVRASLGSHCQYAVAAGGRWIHQRPEVTVTALPAGCQAELRLDGSSLQRAFTVLIEPHALLEHCSADSLSQQLRDVLSGPIRDAHSLLSMPISANIAALVGDLIRSRLDGDLLAMQVKARSIELLAWVIQEWREQPYDSGSNAARLRSQRDGPLLAAAQRVLTERCSEPPTVRALARELGTNKNKLTELFRNGLGVTPKAFSLQRRMERAQALILEGRLTVGQVADEVGYQHHSSFSIAFRELTGVSPSEFARRHRPMH